MTLALDENGDVEHRLLWGPAVDQILAEENGAGDVYWMLTDNQNTVRDVVEYDSGLDETNVVNHIAYDSFGNKLSETDDTLDVLDINYTGRYFDEATGLQWNLNRWYNPEVGKWMSEDPIGFEDGTNSQMYVHNNPTNATDPRGLATLDFTPRVTQNMPWKASLWPYYGHTTPETMGIGFETKPICVNGRIRYRNSFTLVIELEIELNLADIKNDPEGAGQTLQQIYGHEQRHVESVRAYAYSIAGQLTVAEKSYTFSSRSAAEKYAKEVTTFYINDLKNFSDREADHGNILSPKEMEPWPPIGGQMPPATSSPNRPPSRNPFPSPSQE
jgi:RHS repeat-associated protein